MNNKQLNMIDLMGIASFCIGLMNLDENITQGDVQDLANGLLNEIHTHLESQDIKLDNIIERLERLENDTGRNI